jgi:hypothetical protein
MTGETMLDVTKSNALIAKLEAILSPMPDSYQIPLRKADLLSLIYTARFWRDRYFSVQAMIEAATETKQ